MVWGSGAIGNRQWGEVSRRRRPPPRPSPARGGGGKGYDESAVGGCLAYMCATWWALWPHYENPDKHVLSGKRRCSGRDQRYQ